MTSYRVIEGNVPVADVRKVVGDLEAEILDLQLQLDFAKIAAKPLYSRRKLEAEHAQMLAALSDIIKEAPNEEPEDPGNVQNSGDDRGYGSDLAYWWCAKIARAALPPGLSKWQPIETAADVAVGQRACLRMKDGKLKFASWQEYPTTAGGRAQAWLHYDEVIGLYEPAEWYPLRASEEDRLIEQNTRLREALAAMLPENVPPGDDPSGMLRPSFATCEKARAALSARSLEVE